MIGCLLNWFGQTRGPDERTARDIRGFEGFKAMDAISRVDDYYGF